MVDENRIEGVAKNLGGKVQDAVGGLTGSSTTQARGKVNEAAGSAQQAYGQVADDVRNFASERPVVALLGAIGFGVILGFFLGRR